MAHPLLCAIAAWPGAATHLLQGSAARHWAPCWRAASGGRQGDLYCRQPAGLHSRGCQRAHLPAAGSIGGAAPALGRGHSSCHQPSCCCGSRAGRAFPHQPAAERQHGAWRGWALAIPPPRTPQQLPECGWWPAAFTWRRRRHRSRRRGRQRGQHSVLLCSRTGQAAGGSAALDRCPLPLHWLPVRASYRGQACEAWRQQRRQRHISAGVCCSACSARPDRHCCSSSHRCLQRQPAHAAGAWRPAAHASADGGGGGRPTPGKYLRALPAGTSVPGATRGGAEQRAAGGAGGALCAACVSCCSAAACNCRRALLLMLSMVELQPHAPPVGPCRAGRAW